MTAGSLPSSTSNASMAKKTGWKRRFLLVAVAIAIVMALIKVYTNIDQEALMAAFDHLAWWHGAVLLLVLLVRQLLNASPLAIYIPQISFARATINDLGASTASAFAPPPSDMVVRVSMFSSWGVPMPRALAATTMNALTLFIVRFGIPVMGFALLPLTGQSLGLRAIDLLSLFVSAVLFVGVLAVVRGQARAAAIGFWLGTVLRKVRAQVRPEDWSEGFSTFQRNIADGFSTRFPRAIVMTVLMVCADLTVLTLAIRFVGITAHELPFLVIASGFFFVYPLTLFPMQGTGVLDTTLLTGLVAVASDTVTEPALAAFVIWRAFTLAGPFCLGAIAIFFWRHSLKRHPTL